MNSEDSHPPPAPASSRREMAYFPRKTQVMVLVFRYINYTLIQTDVDLGSL